MKKIVLLLAVAGVAFLSSCGKEPKEEPKPFPIGTWQTNHEYFDLTVDRAEPAYLKERLEKEVSGAVSDTEAYRLTFNEDGTGSGSGAYPDGTGWYDFDFTWKLSEQGLSLTKSGDVNVFFYRYDSWRNVDPLDIISGDFVLKKEVDSFDKITWTVEESSVSGMVLSFYFKTYNHISEGILDLKEIHTYRYTFEKVESK